MSAHWWMRTPVVPSFAARSIARATSTPAMPRYLRAPPTRCQSLSGHADQKELLDWMEPAAAGLKKVFLVHGEPVAQQALKARIEERYKLEVFCPRRGDRFEVG